VETWEFRVEIAMVDKQLEILASPVNAPVLHLVNDIHALMESFKPSLPPKWAVLPSTTAVVCHGFGDASGTVFGTAILINDVLHYRYGQWSTSNAESSSNYRELCNLVLGVEEARSSELLTNCDFFMFTDNSAAEAAFHKGSSSNKVLFSLVLLLRLLQMHHGFFLHVIHVTGLWMREQGTDGLSRGALDGGVLQGSQMLSYVPLHVAALDCAPQLKQWILTWCGSSTPKWLKPFDWFTSGHHEGMHFWTPPPVAADGALEQVAVTINKRLTTQHIILIPRLMTVVRRKLLGKICDLIFTVPLGADIWPHHHCKPLVVGCYFPLLKHKPWRNVESQLSGLSRDTFDWGGDATRGPWTVCQCVWYGNCYVQMTMGNSPLPSLKMRKAGL
jgi:hypothetical protein